jgi:fumarylacetoacetase
MTHTPNETHDPALRSWVASANEPGCDFPIQNLPFGVFRRFGRGEAFRVGVAIGNKIVDVTAVQDNGLFSGAAVAPALMARGSTLNGLMATGPAAWSQLRLALSRMLRQGSREAARLSDCLVPQSEAVHALPAQIGDYTDFFTSQYHALNAGRVFQPDNPMLPNFKWLPIGYHGRSSSIEISGGSFHRPWGQSRAPGEAEPSFGPSQRVDYELELGAFIGAGNRRGEPIDIDEAESHVFGLCLLNDWSARDVQGWEAMPLGPFLAKNFVTTISPWIVTMEALAPFRCALPRAQDDPPTLPYLRPRSGQGRCAIDIELEVRLEHAALASEGVALSRTNYRHAYWSVGQMVAHHTSNGCNLRPGDLLGTGTQSGPTRGEEGCLLELTRGGKEPLGLSNGETRSYLHDGDTVVMHGWCEREGFARIGFGECRGSLLPALAEHTGAPLVGEDMNTSSVSQTALERASCEARVPSRKDSPT